MSDAKRSDRRVFLTGGVVGGAAGIVAAAAAGVLRQRSSVHTPGGPNESTGAGPNVHTGERVHWRLASSFPASLDTIYGASEVLSERVAAMSGGAFTVESYEAGEFVGALEVMGSIQRGTVEVGQTAGYYNLGKSEALAFDTCLPFGFTPRQQNAWLHEAGGLELVREVYADFNVISFPCGNTGAQMGGWFRRRIDGLDDLKGLTMRIPGLGGKVMQELGVSVQNIAAGEVYQSLERGQIDAAEWVGPYDDEKLGFHRIAKNYYYPGWWEPGPSLSFLVNLDAWAKLPAVYREIFKAASAEAAATMQNRYDAKNPGAFARLKASDVVMRAYSDDIMQGAHDASLQLFSDSAAADGTYRRLYEHWSKFRKDSFAWFGASELAYAQFSFG
ncbi:MAG: TRAP transporter substrate-binding protein DctP [Planctomycetota bacterium]|nr:TRAP transporter substrate-binding protein DctP [Planctomycetota bacterium]